MQNPTSTFIVLEGADGSGKGTQLRLLKERLLAVGYEVEVFDFPRYEQPSSYFISKYLNGDYGPASKISPYTASLFYALDRYEAAVDIKKALHENKIVLSNRFVGSNMAHQGSKFEDPIEQRGFFVWEDSLEFELLGLPRPNVNLFLKVPAETSYELIKQKLARSYTAKSHDEHESDMNHLRRSVKTYDLLCELFPSDFKTIDCTVSGQLMSITDISNKIWESVQLYLPEKPSGGGHSITLNLKETEPVIGSSNHDLKQRPKQAKISLALASELVMLLPEEVSYNLNWAASGYDYLMPPQLSQNAQKRYQLLMDQIISTHKEMTKRLTSKGLDIQLLTPTIPLAALIPVNVLPKADFVDKIALGLPQLLIEDFNSLAKAVNIQAIQKPPEALGKILKRYQSNHGGALSAETEPLNLVESSPRNELKLLAEVVYPYSNLAKDQIEAELDSWTYQQKHQALATAIKSGSSILDKVRYNFDIIDSRLNMANLKKSGLASNLQLQPSTPRYGYEVSKQIEDSGLETLYLEAYDKSLELYSLLQASGEKDFAIYGTLLGHKTRGQFSCTLRQLLEIYPLNQPDNIGSVINQIVQVIAAVHPIIAENLISDAQTKPLPELVTSNQTSHPVKKRNRKRRR